MGYSWHIGVDLKPRSVSSWCVGHSVCLHISRCGISDKLASRFRDHRTYRLDFKVQRNERKDEDLSRAYVDDRDADMNGPGLTHLEILHQVVEYSHSIRVIRVLNVDQRPDFGSLLSAWPSQGNRRER